MTTDTSAAKELFMKGLDAIDSNKFAEAEQLFLKTIEIVPNHISTLTNLSFVQLQQSKVDAAIDTARRIVEIDSQNIDAYLTLASCRISQGNFEAALLACDKAIEINAQSADAHSKRGVCLSALGRYEEAILTLTRATEFNSQQPDSFVYLGSALGKLSRHDQALAAYNKALAIQPSMENVWLVCGDTLIRLKQYDEALAAYDKALSLNADMTQALLGRGNALIELHRFDEASAALEKALVLNPDLVGAWLSLGSCQMNLKQPDNALASYGKAVAINPDSLNAWLGRGSVQMDLGQLGDALASFDRAAFLNPTFEGALIGRANALMALKRYGEAWEAYRQASEINAKSKVAWLGRGNAAALGERYDQAIADYDNALALDSALENVWLGRGNVFTKLHKYDEGFAAYDKAISLNPGLENAWLGRGNIFAILARHKEALAAYRGALKINPDLAKAWVGVGITLGELRKFDEALKAFDKATELDPTLDNAWLKRGDIYQETGRYDEAFTAYDRAFAIDPNSFRTEGARLNSKIYLCNWKDFEGERAHLIESVRQGKINTSPFVVLCVSESAQDQLQCARLWITENHPLSDKRLWNGEKYSHEKIRVAYLSGDFTNHAVSYLLAGVIDAHDKQAFEVVGISFGVADNSDMRLRLQKSFDSFIDVRDRSDFEVAQLLRGLEIDVAIDLAGFTAGSRTNIFGHRPCPIQVNYLGYPGTLGADYIDYLIADPTLIPSSDEEFYAEKIAFLPDTYLPSDSAHRAISTKPLNRSDFGLPQNGVVFCCFNNSYKLNPTVFAVWMNILKAVNSSVLWLSQLPPSAEKNLKEQAAAANVNPDRLVFARRLNSSADHLARHRLADLFLDVWPYNAHTTASDALWAGLPVLTKIGGTFAGRVAASLLSVAGLNDLVTADAKEYQNKAVWLATHPDELRKVKDRLQASRNATPLFDTKLFTRNLEKAYRAMYKRQQCGLPAARIVVASEEI